jgi:hypothetical protein
MILDDDCQAILFWRRYRACCGERLSGRFRACDGFAFQLLLGCGKK